MFGCISIEKKQKVLATILHFAGKNLKRLYLHGFDFIDTYIGDSLSHWGIQAIMEIDSNPVRSLGSVLALMDYETSQ